MFVNKVCVITGDEGCHLIIIHRLAVINLELLIQTITVFSNLLKTDCSLNMNASISII
jgi:hypothetical protein